MEPYYSENGIVIINADCRVALPDLADGSVDSVVTDPPYHLTQVSRNGSPRTNDPETPFGRTAIGERGFMGKTWDGGDVAHDPAVWSECLRVLKPGGHLLAFGGSRTVHRLVCAIEDSGFEVRDMLTWLFGSGFPKSLNISKAIDAAAGADRETVGSVRRWGNAATKGRGGQYANDYESTVIGAEKFDTITAPATDAAKQWDGWGTALKPAAEYITLARKPLIGTVAQNILEHGTGGLNVDGCRIGSGEDKTEGGCSGNGKIFGGGISQRAETDFTVGRWPANVIHDGSDEVLASFPDAPGQQRALTGREAPKQGTPVYGDYGPRPVCEPRDDFGSAARFFYCAKASQEDRNEGLEEIEFRQRDESRKEGSPGGDNPRNRGLAKRQNHHPTVKPTDLMRYLVRLVTPPGGIVLDPFAGSGSTGKACALEGMNAILIEKEIEYCELAARRARLRQPILNFA